jgi:Fe-S oxidoreductase
MNILEPIVQGYMFKEMMDVAETPQMGGGLPLTKLVADLEFVGQKGGEAKRETPLLKRLEHLAVPFGLVYVPYHDPEHQLRYKERVMEPDGIVDNILYDKLVDMVSHRPSGQKTRKNHSKQV